MAHHDIIESVPQRVKTRVDAHSKAIAQYYKDNEATYQTRSYGELWEEVEALGSSLFEVGVGYLDYQELLSSGRELTNTLKIRRTVASQMHRRTIEKIFR